MQRSSSSAPAATPTWGPQPASAVRAREIKAMASPSSAVHAQYEALQAELARKKRQLQEESDAKMDQLIEYARATADATLFTVGRVRSAAVFGPEVDMRFVWVNVERDIDDDDDEPRLRPFEIEPPDGTDSTASRMCRLLVAVPNSHEHDGMTEYDAGALDDEVFLSGFRSVSSDLIHIAKAKYGLGNEYANEDDLDIEKECGAFVREEHAIHADSTDELREEHVIDPAYAAKVPHKITSFRRDVNDVVRRGNRVADTDIVDAIILPENYSTLRANRERSLIFSSSVVEMSVYPAAIKMKPHRYMLDHADHDNDDDDDEDEENDDDDDDHECSRGAMILC